MRNFTFAGCRAVILLKKQLFHKYIPKVLAKLAYQPLACGVVKNLIIKAFGYFYNHL